MPVALSGHRGHPARLAMLPDMERQDLLARIQAVRASGHEAWVTTRTDGRLVVETDRPR
jgi:hypothetical protein